MRKDTKQIINSNFTLLVLELEELIKQGYSVVKEGDARPYHLIMGNFQVTVEKDVDDELCNPVSEVVEGEPLIAETGGSPDGASKMKPQVQQNQRGRKSK